MKHLSLGKDTKACETGSTASPGPRLTISPHHTNQQECLTLVCVILRSFSLCTTKFLSTSRYCIMKNIEQVVGLVVSEMCNHPGENNGVIWLFFCFVLSRGSGGFQFSGI